MNEYCELPIACGWIRRAVQKDSSRRAVFFSVENRSHHAAAGCEAMPCDLRDDRKSQGTIRARDIAGLVRMIFWGVGRDSRRLFGC